MPEYLVSYGAEGFLARCASPAQVECVRGDRVLIRGHRGVELARVLEQARPEHARFLPDRMAVQLMQHAEDDDFAGADFQQSADEVFAAARSAVEAHGLPIEIVDVELLLEPRTIILHYLRFGSGKLRELVKDLAARFQALVEMQDLALGVATEYGDAHNERYCNSTGKVGGGCGSGGGGCGSGGCGSGGCGSGGCGSGACGSSGVATPAHHDDELIPELFVRPARA